MPVTEKGFRFKVIVVAFIEIIATRNTFVRCPFVSFIFVCLTWLCLFRIFDKISERPFCFIVLNACSFCDNRKK